MSYVYRDDLTSADAAFDVEGESEEDLASSAVDAVLGLMVSHPASISHDVRKIVTLHAGSFEDLLHQVLEWVIYFKDVDGLLMRLTRFNLPQLDVEFQGARIPQGPENLGIDVKAITWHAYQCTRGTRAGAHWRATVVVDT